MDFERCALRGPDDPNTGRCNSKGSAIDTRSGIHRTTIREGTLSDFIESVDELVAEHFSSDAHWALREFLGHNDSVRVRRLLNNLIRGSIAHARSQVENRGTGTMTFDQAMQLVFTRNAKVTRPEWSIFRAVALEPALASEPGSMEVNSETIEKALTSFADRETCFFLNWNFDNCDGFPSGSGFPYNPTEEGGPGREGLDAIPGPARQLGRTRLGRALILFLRRSGGRLFHRKRFWMANRRLI